MCYFCVGVYIKPESSLLHSVRCISIWQLISQDLLSTAWADQNSFVVSDVNAGFDSGT